MKPLLETTDPRYLRRLVRELNFETRKGNGFYCKIAGNWTRCSQARFRRDYIECRQLGGTWKTPAAGGFIDVHSRDIVARRSVR